MHDATLASPANCRSNHEEDGQMSVQILGAYMLALLIVFILPGPDMALILQTSAAAGARRGMLVAAGLACARTLHVTLSACGVAALLRAKPELYTLVRLIGAVYLAYVAWHILRSGAFMPSASTETVPGRPAATFYKGMLSNLLNPKALLFCSVLMPQFVRPEAGHVPAQVALLGALLVWVGFSLDTVYALGASRLARWLGRHPGAQFVQRWTFSAVLFAFALRLSLD